jgi:predicted permease
MAGAGSDRRVISISHALVGFEIACTLILLTGAGLFTKTFVSIARRDPGIAQHSVVVGEVYAHGLGFDQPDQQRLLANSVLDQVSRLPSVAAVGILGRAEGPPILNIALAQSASVASSGAVPRSVISTSPDYFRAAGVALLAGREFRTADRLSAPPVAILDEVAAERLFGRASPIGQRIKFGLASSALAWVEIVGVVRTVTGTRLIPAHQPRPTIYVPIDQVPALGLSIAVRTLGPSSQALPAIRDALHTAAPNVPIAILTTIEARLSDEIAPARTNLVMIGVFACVAVILASLAVYGVVSHVVMQRRGEFAIRLALGARGRDIIRLALRRVGAVTLVGLGVGAASSWALVRFLRALLYGTSPTDTGVFAGAILLVLVISFTAAVLGARRVGLIDPASTLRG